MARLHRASIHSLSFRIAALTPCTQESHRRKATFARKPINPRGNFLPALTFLTCPQGFAQLIDHTTEHLSKQTCHTAATTSIEVY